LAKWTPGEKREYAHVRYKRLKQGMNDDEKIKGDAPRPGTLSRQKEKFSGSFETSAKLRGDQLPDSTSISLTGNPFVDTGLAVIASRQKLASPDKITLDDLKAVHKDGVSLARDVQTLKAFTMIFTRNSLLTQFPKNDRAGIKEKRIKMHAAITTEFLNAIGNETEDELCESCGNERTLNLSDAVNRALSSFGEEPKERFVGRDWFPLAGSMGSDAQALPAASRAPQLCAKCLFSVQYLPLGVTLLGRELAVFQSTSQFFWYGLARHIAEEVQRKIAAGDTTILGSKEGRAGFAKQLLTFFQHTQERKILSGLEEDTTVFAWRFTNSGTSADIQIEEIPSYALRFLWKAVVLDLQSEIRNILSKEKTAEEYTFFMCIVRRVDYYGLYPGKLGKEKGYRGVSPELFSLYQREILGRTDASLKAAHQIAKLGLDHVRQKHKRHEKQLERLTRKEAFEDRQVRGTFKRIMAVQARLGNFDLEKYLAIFPYSGSRLSVSFSGWNLIRYYLGVLARNVEVEFTDEDSEVATVTVTTSTSDFVSFYAYVIFDEYVRNRGRQRFEKDILNQLERGKIGVAWLRSQFLTLARKYKSFTYDDWSRLCFNEEGRWTISELLFQFRLLWCQWLRSDAVEKENVVKTEPDAFVTSKLPTDIAKGLLIVFDQYILSRGLVRTGRDILEPLRRRKMGIEWFRSKLVDGQNAMVAENKFNEFVNDPLQNLTESEKAFQMSLFLENLYRLTSSSPDALYALRVV
jgi:hypothetical protein